MIKDIVLSLIIIISLVTDLKEQKILNKVIIPGILAGFALNIYEMGWAGLIFSGQGFLVGIGLLLIPFLLGGMGAGDVKLLGAIGAIKGVVFVFYAFLGTALAGGLIAVIIFIVKKRFLSTLKKLWTGLYMVLISRNFSSLKNLEQNSENATYFPYGLAITAGTLAAFLMR